MIIKTTGVGSVPFDNIQDAISFVKECTIPYLPELKNENMLTILDNANYFEQENWQLFLKSIKGFSLIKLQIIGPLTYQFLKKDLGDYQKKFLNAFEKIKKDLKEIPFILILDEPCLIKNKNDEELNKILKLIDIPEYGIHCCDKFKFSDLKNLPIKYLSFDISLFTDDEILQLGHQYKLILGGYKEQLIRIQSLAINEVLVSSPCGLKNLTLGEVKLKIISPS